MRYQTISKRMAKEYIEKKQGFLLDVRPYYESAEDPIYGAVCIPYTEINYTTQLPRDKNRIIIVFCNHGGHSRSVCQILLQRGFLSVFDLGGIG